MLVFIVAKSVITVEFLPFKILFCLYSNPFLLKQALNGGLTAVLMFFKKTFFFNCLQPEYCITLNNSVAGCFCHVVCFNSS